MLREPSMATQDDALPTIIAHRGNAAEFPENTLAALESAVELGVRHLEFDVQLTADRMPVLFHDADLRRVGDREDSVHDLTWSQFAETPVGENSRFARRFAFTYPTSLAQAVDAIAGWRGVTAFVEVKRSSLRRFGREVVLRRIADVVRPVLDRCVLISFDLASVRILKLMTGARIGLVLERYDEASLLEAQALRPEFLFCNLERIPEDAAALHAGPWEWAIYEVRDVQTAQRCRRLGARYVETMAVRGLLSGYEQSRRQW
jgi:glycerophosphoryl diester phosphodiesterase